MKKIKLTPAEILSDLIREKMEIKGVKQEKIAKELTISPPQISRYIKAEENFLNIQVRNLLKIATYFNVSTDYLLGLAQEPTTDKDLNFVCEYTGLSEKAIEKIILNNFKFENVKSNISIILNKMLESDLFYRMLYELDAYIVFNSVKEIDTSNINIEELDAIRKKLSEITNETYTLAKYTHLRDTARFNASNIFNELTDKICEVLNNG